ncbi:unnamed protein product [Didymodactylos carnosus]|uniref:NAD(P)(+)--arginine ADP-ribosyltransferase n=1 Tax=Didymodactylos carnosus TaxID=1234261 RepID=A0A815FUA4_9BILA|nr:unnamed protein product [Didymodactylos carnosus]CAF1325301.1 unnamed protein product [Didymodactylos carnosus]CAF3966117.1 unnamed protein product [Didymodactylos carnosus]CAF4174543.1 unnamed protein product [Didymodactylos carnosus]
MGLRQTKHSPNIIRENLCEVHAHICNFIIPSNHVTTKLPVNDYIVKHNQREFMLIYLDKNMDENTVDVVSRLNEHLQRFDDQLECIKFIRSIENTNKAVFLIIPGSLANNLLNEIHSLKQIDSIFIYCRKRYRYESLLEKYDKIVDICTELDDLDIKLQQNLERYLTIFNFYNIKKSIRDLNRESAEFIWFQLLQSMLMKLPHNTEQAKQELLTQCRLHYRTRKGELDTIKKFEDEYKSDDAIQWYTKNSFLYRIVNQALRTEYVEELYTFRYYIVDLCLHLLKRSNEFKQLKENFQRVITLYRGSEMSSDELTKIKLNQGGLIATNGFLSTSRNKRIAKSFANIQSSKTVGEQNTNGSNKLVSVLFEIDVNVQLSSIILADISDMSQFPEEEEMLFGLGAAFKIDSVEETINEFSRKYTLVKMHATNEGKEIAKDYIAYKQEIISGGNVSIVFGQLLTNMAEYRNAIAYFKNLLNKHEYNDDNDLATIHFCIADALMSIGEYEQASDHCQYSYSIYSKNNTIDGVANTLARMASVSIWKKEYDSALTQYEQAITLYKMLKSKQDVNIANCQNGLGDVYFGKKNYPKALSNYIDALNVREKHLPNEHPEIAQSYFNIGKVYSYHCNFEKAFRYLNIALEKKQKIFPSHHPTIGCTLYALGNVCYSNEKTGKALDYYNRALECYEHTLPPNHHYTINVKKDIEKVTKHISHQF